MEARQQRICRLIQQSAARRVYATAAVFNPLSAVHLTATTRVQRGCPQSPRPWECQ